GSAISWDYFFQMQARLRANRVPQPWSFVCHPFHWYQLQKAASVAGTRTNAADNLLNAVNSMFLVDRVAGVDIYVSSYIEPDGQDDSVVAMFGRSAIALDLRRAPRLEPERDASRRGWELNLSAVFAHGTWRPTHGIKGVFDTTLP